MNCSKQTKTRFQDDVTKYKKQRNLVVKLNRYSKLCYFDSLETSKKVKHF